MSAPTKLDQSAQDKILGALAVGADVGLAAAVVRCSRNAIYKLRNRNPDFAEKMDAARNLADEKVVQALYSAATQDRNITAMIFWLKNRQPRIWRDRHELAVQEVRTARLDIRLDDGTPIASLAGVPAKGIN